MKIEISWVFLISIFGIVVGLFFALTVLGMKKGKKEVRLSLAALILAITSVAIPPLLQIADFYNEFPHLMGTFLRFYLALGPLLYLYVQSITTPDFRFKKGHLLHFVPLLLSIVFWMPFYLKSGEQKLYLYSQSSIYSPLVDLIRYGANLIHPMIYLILTYVHLQKHSQKAQTSFSAVEKIKLKWMKYLVWGLVSLVVMYFVENIFCYFDRPSLIEHTKKLIHIWNPLLLVFLGYKGLTQTELFADDEKKKGSRKYKYFDLSQESTEKYLNKIQSLMHEEKPYLRSELLLGDLADELDFSPRLLSQLINDELQLNFYAFINQYRINEAKRLLSNKDTQKYTILSIAFDSGFNSKSSFNTVFKQYTKMTPSHYRKIHNSHTLVE